MCIWIAMYILYIDKEIIYLPQQQEVTTTVRRTGLVTNRVHIIHSTACELGTLCSCSYPWTNCSLVFTSELTPIKAALRLGQRQNTSHQNPHLTTQLLLHAVGFISTYAVTDFNRNVNLVQLSHNFSRLWPLISELERERDIYIHSNTFPHVP